jgi:hypothetical protein
VWFLAYDISDLLRGVIVHSLLYLFYYASIHLGPTWGHYRPLSFMFILFCHYYIRELLWGLVVHSLLHLSYSASMTYGTYYGALSSTAFYIYYIVPVSCGCCGSLVSNVWMGLFSKRQE